mmetsp:Transcript_64653/g.173212  ORF Transcript_64653/g.173212 Transcript_64653/m.173212 type:complete len:204 (-) Transcript_64653:198-809(-)
MVSAPLHAPRRRRAPLPCLLSTRTPAAPMSIAGDSAVFSANARGSLSGSCTPASWLGGSKCVSSFPGGGSVSSFPGAARAADGGGRQPVAVRPRAVARGAPVEGPAFKLAGHHSATLQADFGGRRGGMEAATAAARGRRAGGGAGTCWRRQLFRGRTIGWADSTRWRSWASAALWLPARTSPAPPPPRHLGMGATLPDGGVSL